MPLRAAIEGEDVPLTVSYEADDGTAVDPDDTTVDPTVTITDEADTEVVTDVLMSQNGTGEFEHVWDTATNATGRGTYTVDASADFNTETKITRSSIELR